MDLTFAEVVRALRALSSRYVDRRASLQAALDPPGKRAAFALFYGPLHFLRAAGLDHRLLTARSLWCPNRDLPGPATAGDHD